jgi:hypothetical protein
MRATRVAGICASIALDLRPAEGAPSEIQPSDRRVLDRAAAGSERRCAELIVSRPTGRR